jgi:hypothetical protein
MKKTHDLVVKKSTYTDRSGNTKSKWLNIGAMMEDDRGGIFLMLDRSVNLAALPYKDGSESVVVSLFEPKAQEQSNHDKLKADGYQPEGASNEIAF